MSLKKVTTVAQNAVCTVLIGVNQKPLTIDLTINIGSYVKVVSRSPRGPENEAPNVTSEHKCCQIRENVNEDCM